MKQIKTAKKLYLYPELNVDCTDVTAHFTENEGIAMLHYNSSLSMAKEMKTYLGNYLIKMVKAVGIKEISI